MNVLEVNGIKKIYRSRFGTNQVEALKNITFSVEKGEYIAIMGESGSGKTTLLNILAALDKPTAGTVLLEGQNLTGIKESAMATFRRDNLGFVFQEFNLLDTFSVEDNIFLPLVLSGKKNEEMVKRLEPIAVRLGIDSLLKKYPYEISGGQKQRVAIARAIITEPRIILADEPTGALDSRSTDDILRIFADINKAGQTILMVTHSIKAASKAGRVLFIRDGEVFHQIYRGDATDEQLYQKISDTLTRLQAGELRSGANGATGADVGEGAGSVSAAGAVGVAAGSVGNVCATGADATGAKADGDGAIGTGAER
ncbi:MAG: ABC transporter ATP-binding protein [Treponemataceae bacterium]|nr:ABC transporter ATP-binding protein [Treponemataceae bacterium]